MKSRENELKAEIMKDVEAEIDGMLKWDEAAGRVLTVHEMEERVLEIRQRVGERVMKGLLDYQVGKMKEEAPVSGVSGKRLHNKGKKNEIVTRLGRVSYSRTYYHDSAGCGGRSPLDEAMGIVESLSNGVRHDIVKLSADR